MKRFRMIFSQVKAVLEAYKVRTAIAVVGVLLGAMSLVTVQNVALSLEKRVQEEIKFMGDRVVSIFARAPRQGGVWMRRDHVNTMKAEDLHEIAAIEGVVNIAPMAHKTLIAKRKNVSVDAYVIGTDNNFFSMRGYPLNYGRYFEELDLEQRERAAVLGSSVAEELFGADYAMGEVLYLGNTPFTVVGVLSEKGSDAYGNSQDGIVIIPLKTAQTRLLNQNYLNEIIIQLRTWGDFEVVARDITRVLRISHNIAPEKLNDFDIIDPIEEQRTATTFINIAQTLGSVSAGIAFFIGMIGIFSLMLLIVSQRATEIGIKRAIGATRSDILFQFLFESGFVGVLGGMSGLFAGCVLSAAVCYFAELPFQLSFFGLFLGLTSAIFSGTAAGLYPAIKASRVVPVEALQR